MTLHLPTKFYQNGTTPIKLLRHTDLTSQKPTSEFGFGTGLGMTKSTYTPNFDAISQSTAELLILPVSENGRPPYWSHIFIFDLTYSSSSAWRFASAHQISS